MIKTKLLNDIIIVGEHGQRYLNFVTLSNGDMLFQAFSETIDGRRKFYGLKRNGRGYFTKNETDEETPFYSLFCSKVQKYESTNAIFIKDENDYFLNMGRLTSYTDLFDIKNKNIVLVNKTDTLLGFHNINIGANLIKIDTNIYILSGLKPVIPNIYNGDYYPNIIKINLSIIYNLTLKILEINEQNSTFLEFGSCFLTEQNEIIVCFYGHGINSNYKYLILAYNKNLTLLDSEVLALPGIKNSKYYYFYSIFFREDAGVFVYYTLENSECYPSFYFIKFEDSKKTFENYFPNIEKIILNRFLFNTGRQCNDIIKISNNKVAFFSVSNNNKYYL